jgi:hypothetical protein
MSAPGDYDSGEIGGMIGKGNRSTRRTHAPVPLCPPQTPHAARTRTRAAAVCTGYHVFLLLDTNGSPSADLFAVNVNKPLISF